MGKRTFGAIIACALACVIAACGSSHGTTRTSLINATTPTTASTAATASTPGTLTLGEKVPDPSALPQAGTASTITPTGPTATSATPSPTTTSATPSQSAAATTPSKPAPAVAVPATGPLNAAQFESAANAICLHIDTKARSIGGAGASASESAATKLDALELLSQQAVASLQTLAPRGSAASQRKDAAFVKETKKEIAIGVLAAQDATAGAQTAYGNELDQLSVISAPVIAAGKALAPACAEG
jgi:hypothetical protein